MTLLFTHTPANYSKNLFLIVLQVIYLNNQDYPLAVAILHWLTIKFTTMSNGVSNLWLEEGSKNTELSVYLEGFRWAVNITLLLPFSMGNSV